MRTETAKAPEAITFERAYPGTISQPRQVRADLAKIATEFPAADDLLLLASELATNAVLHSESGHPDQEFTVRATFYVGAYAWVEIIDAGGAWARDKHDDEHGRGLAVVAGIAGDGNWGIEGDASCRVAWFRLTGTSREPAEVCTGRRGCPRPDSRRRPSAWAVRAKWRRARPADGIFRSHLPQSTLGH